MKEGRALFQTKMFILDTIMVNEEAFLSLNQ